MKNRIFTGIAFVLISALLTGQDLYTELAGEIDITVAADGTEDFTSISEAVNSVPRNSSTRTVIFVKNGVYYEKFEVASGLNKITLVGEDVDSTVLVYDDYSGSGEIYDGIISGAVGNEIGTSSSHTMYIDSDEFTLLNFTVKNSAGDVGQAVAVNLGGDRTILAHCRILGNQDTFYTWGYGRFLMYDCFIEGDVDFIFGRGTALFDSCIIHSNRGSSDITAASTDADWKFGYVFQNCRITAYNGLSSVSMGRPWRANAQTVFINSYLGAHIKSGGWSDWDGRSATCFYAEYNNYGPGSDVSGRVSWANQLSAQEAAVYTRENIFAKGVNPSNYRSDWNPEIHADVVYRAVKKHTELLYADTLYVNAELKFISVNGTALEDFDPSKKSYGIELSDTTKTMPVINCEALSERAAVEITYPDELPGRVKIIVISASGFTSTYYIRFRLVAGVKSGFQEIGSITNPFGEELKFQVIPDADIRGAASATLIDVTGKIYLTMNFTELQAGNTYRITTGNLSPGIYIFNISNGDRIFNQKVVKR